MIQFLLAGVLAVFLAYRSQFENKDKLLFWSFVVMWYIAAFQDCVGVDFSNYMSDFYLIQQGIVTPSLFRVDRDHIELGWYLLNKGIGSVFGTFYAVTPIVYAIILYPIYKLVKLVPPQYRWLSVLWFFFGIKWFLFEMSGQRQGLSMAFWILLVFALKDKKYFRAIIFFILGVSFHNSFIFAVFLILLTRLHYEKIDFSKRKGVWIVGAVGVFLLGFFFADRLVHGIRSLTFILSRVGNEDVYSGYFKELIVHDRSITNLISGILLLSFVVIAFASNKVKMFPVANAEMYYALFIIVFALESSIGSFGSLVRIFRYVGFFSLPAISITAYHLNKKMRFYYIAYIVFYTMYSFFTSIQTPQYMGYLDYHTIFF